ncbi:MAG: hypothetical protein QNJ47_19570 [Nostocaceae cyanobacterium]|nr:hypothetical protein [Nostocaceae cyanobacterium]
MLQSENKSFKVIPFFLSYTFLISYILSIVTIIIFGYLFQKNREIKEYKQVTFWYENLNTKTQHKKIFSDFVEKAQNKLTQDYNSYFKNPGLRKLPPNITAKIIIDQNLPEEGNPVPWKIEKTGESVNAYYGYSGVIDFDNNQINREQEKKRNEAKNQIVEDKIFQNFAYIMQSQIKDDLVKKTKSNDNDIQNLHIFSKVWIKYLTGNEKYSDIIPTLRINNVYVLNVDTGFFISYPFTDEGYRPVSFRTRPWFKATENNYASSFRKEDEYNNDSGLTGIYIDINDEKKPNAIRTLWYKFQDNISKKKYILCFDLFLDKSSQISKADNWLYLPESTIKSGIWVYLLLISLIVALCLSLIYEFKLKDIIIRISKHHANDLVKIKLQLERKHYASKDEGEIRFTIQGETKDINQSEQSREARWSFNIQNIQVGFSNNQSHTKQQEATSRYEFTNEYNLNMSQNKPQYRCIETWKVVSESQSYKTQKIGFFVAKWDINNSADIEEGLDIKSIYWEREYEEYLGIFKEQLREHLLISDEKELVAVLDRNYSRKQNIPSFITGIDSLKQIINSSSYLKQGKIIFSEVETLTDLYKQGMVNAICSLHFLRKLLDNKKLKDFFQTQVHERYLIEYQPGEFWNFYNSLDDETKSELRNQSPFKIMVYQDNIDNIVSAQDDFCIISINNTPKLVAYSFTDGRFSNAGWVGWISWREVDIKFYDELYRCQKDKNHRIENITTYLGNIPNI